MSVTYLRRAKHACLVFCSIRRSSSSDKESKLAGIGGGGIAIPLIFHNYNDIHYNLNRLIN